MSRSARVQIASIATILVIAAASIHVACASERQSNVASTVALLDSRQPAMQAGAAAICTNPYIVRRGDTLAGIAARCGVTVTLLRRWNGLRSDTIWPGQILYTRPPAGRRPPATPAPPSPRPTPAIESTVDPN